jgi:hypothetical protein
MPRQPKAGIAGQEEEVPFLKGVGDEPSKDFRVLDENYGATNAFPPINIEDGSPAVSYYLLKANLALPIPAQMITQKQKGWDKERNEPVLIDYVNVTDLKDLLDERVGVWTAHVLSYQQIGYELCVVVRLSIYASDGIFSSDGTGVNNVDHKGFGDTFSNAYAQAFRRACEGHGMGRELWRKTEHLEATEAAQTSRQADNSEQPHHTQEVPRRDPVAKNLVDMLTSKQLAMIRGLAKEKDINAEEVCKQVMNCSIDELSKRAASDLIEHLSSLATGHDPMSRADVPVPSHTGGYGDSSRVPTSGPPASTKQKDYILNICSDKGANAELISLELFKTNFNEISKPQASQMIEHLIGKKP